MLHETTKPDYIGMVDSAYYGVTISVIGHSLATGPFVDQPYDICLYTCYHNTQMAFYKNTHRLQKQINANSIYYTAL